MPVIQSNAPPVNPLSFDLIKQRARQRVQSTREELGPDDIAAFLKSELGEIETITSDDVDNLNKKYKSGNFFGKYAYRWNENCRECGILTEWRELTVGPFPFKVMEKTYIFPRVAGEAKLTDYSFTLHAALNVDQTNNISRADFASYKNSAGAGL